MFAHWPRRGLLLGLGLLILLLDSVLRLVLVIMLDPDPAFTTCVGLMTLGVLHDVLCTTVMLAPVAWFLLLSGGTSLRHPRWRQVVLTLIAAGLLFLAAVEQAFFDEFTSRFNHIAIDYLLFPGEVATNIWQSYNVPLFVLIALVLGALVAWPLHRLLRGAEFVRLPWKQRAIGALLVVPIAGVAVLGEWLLPTEPTGERARDEVAANGLAQLVRAFATAHLPYREYYRTVPDEVAAPLIHKELQRENAGNPQRTFTAMMHRDRPLDVVVVLEESLGSEFVGRLGGKKTNTPAFDRWSAKGLLLTNLVANGNRTVRGLEGVLCSFLPLPGESVWKRNKSENVATIAQVLGNQGYLTEFFYGGAGIFDGMKPFALANGWQRFIEDGVVSSDFPPKAFRTAWGAADEYVFDRMLARQREAHAAGQPFFGTLLTTSNHKPFLTPNTKQVHWSTAKKMWRLVGIGSGLFIIALLVFIFAGRRIGRVRVGVSACLVLLGYGVYTSVRLQPADTRENAVRYSDQALGNYLDQAAAAGMMEHTIFLVVGDHGARVYGSAEIPAASYRIPGLFLAPDARFTGATIDRLCSQIDLAPTLLSLAGIDYRAPFFGDDLLGPAAALPGRAWLLHNRDCGLLTEHNLMVLGLRKSVYGYQRAGTASDAFTPIPKNAFTDEMKVHADRASALFQEASDLYENRRYHLPAIR